MAPPEPLVQPGQLARRAPPVRQEPMAQLEPLVQQEPMAQLEPLGRRAPPGPHPFTVMAPMGLLQFQHLQTGTSVRQAARSNSQA